MISSRGGSEPSESRDMESLSAAGPIDEATIRQMAAGGLAGFADGRSSTETRTILNLLSRLVDTIEAASVTPLHRAAACNLLSTVLVHTGKASSHGSSNHLWKNGIWRRCFLAYIDRYEDAKPKPVKQLLEALITVLKLHTVPGSPSETRLWFAARLRSALSSTTGASKAHLLATTLSLSRGALDLADLFSVSDQDSFNATAAPAAPAFISRIFSSILPLANNDDLGPTLAALITVMIRKYRETTMKASSVSNDETKTVRDQWVEITLLHATDDPITQSNYRHYVLPAIIGDDFDFLVALLGRLKIGTIFPYGADVNSTESGRGNGPSDLAISVLLIGCSKRFIRISASSTAVAIDVARKDIQLPLTGLARLLSHPVKAMRSGAMELVVDERSITTPVSAQVLQSILKATPTALADVDPDFRSEHYGLFNRLVNRLCASSNALIKKDRRQVQIHEDFLRRTVLQLQQELRPSAPYQRHVSALSCLLILTRSGIDPHIPSRYWSKAAATRLKSVFAVTLFDASTYTSLAELVADPYDDVRAISVRLLTILEHLNDSADKSGDVGVSQLRTSNSLGRLLNVMLARARRSGRADHADSVARLYAAIYAQSTDSISSMQQTESTGAEAVIITVLTNLEGAVQALRADFQSKSQTSSLLPLTMALRYIIEHGDPMRSTRRNHGADSITQIVRRSISCLAQIWSAVKPVLCQDAPEGSRAVEADDVEDADEAKSVLSFSWRALRESSLLQRALFSTLGISGDPVSQEQLVGAVNMSFQQLLELRHRGAFSTVSQTFASCCTALTNQYPEDTKTLPELYHQALRAIETSTTINTRRSAGLPAMITSLIAASAKVEIMLNTAFTDLADIAARLAPTNITDHSALPQVHAMNCLREMFRHSKLGSLTEAFVPAALQLSGECLTSDIWGIRNAGLMLFRSLIDRLNGTNENHEGADSRGNAADLFGKHPKLIDLALQLMRSSLHAEDELTYPQERVFPALQLVEVFTIPETRLPEIHDAVFHLTASSHWHVRDKAARVLAHLPGAGASTGTGVETNTTTYTTCNAMHGRLLYYRHLLRRNFKIDSSTLEQALQLIDTILQTQSSQIVTFTAIDVLREVLHAQSQVDPVSSPWVTICGKALHQVIAAAIYALPSDSNDTTSSIPSHALTSLVVYDWSDATRWPDIAVRLARTDTDACVAMLKEAKDLTSDAQLPDYVKNAMAVTSLAIVNQPDADFDVLVLRAAMSLFTTVYASKLTSSAIVLSHTLPGLDSILRLATTPLLNDDMLMFSAVVLALKLESTTSDALMQDVRKWIIMLQDSTEEHKTFDTRLAAAKAVQRIMPAFNTLRQKPGAADIVTDLAICTYDLTNDDDEDVRTVASTAANIITATEQPMVPLAAGVRILKWLHMSFASHRHLFNLALSRLTGYRNRSTTWQSVSGYLANASDDDGVLFVEERQNLFIDDAREVRLWSHLLMRLQPDSFDRESIKKLAVWTLESLDALKRQALEVEDSPLGWSRKPVTFVLGLRVIYAAEGLLHWRREHRLSSIQSVKIRHKLVRVLSIGQQKGLQPMWLDQMSKVLARDLCAGVGQVGHALQIMEKGCIGNN